MNKLVYILLFGFLALGLASCQEEELRTHFAASMPKFDSVYVAEDAIVYGDSISLTVGVSDPLTPLSTLEIKIVVGDEIVATESVRTKGLHSAYSKKYSIPFVAHMPHGVPVEVHLSTINVEGTHRDTIIQNTIASRPPIPTIYLVTPTSTITMVLTDSVKHIYTAEGLSLTNNITFRLATKINRFKKIDWANADNLIFGWNNGGINLVDVSIVDGVTYVTGDVITLAEPTLVGFKKITLDMFNFTVKGEGDKLLPATLMNTGLFTTSQLTSVDHMNTATKEDWKSAKMYLGKNTKMKISGVADVSNCLDPTFFEVTGTDSVKFLGETGIYTVYYLPRLDYVFVEQPDAVYPKALWLVGVGTGPARTPAIKTSSWNWNTPLEYHFCRKVSEGIYESVFYALHEVDPTAQEAWRLTFGVKFMQQRGWGNEISSQDYAMPNSYLYSPSPNDKGNFNATADFANMPGIYRFTINTITKTTTFVKIR
jgi:hypothetical protein